jgi:hypothetical protein
VPAELMRDLGDTLAGAVSSTPDCRSPRVSPAVARAPAVRRSSTSVTATSAVMKVGDGCAPRSRGPRRVDQMRVGLDDDRFGWPAQVQHREAGLGSPASVVDSPVERALRVGSERVPEPGALHRGYRHGRDPDGERLFHRRCSTFRRRPARPRGARGQSRRRSAGRSAAADPGSDCAS